jgi:hypothetical protein
LIIPRHFGTDDPVNEIERLQRRFICTVRHHGGIRGALTICDLTVRETHHFFNEVF